MEWNQFFIIFIHILVCTDSVTSRAISSNTAKGVHIECGKNSHEHGMITINNEVALAVTAKCSNGDFAFTNVNHSIFTLPVSYQPAATNICVLRKSETIEHEYYVELDALRVDSWKQEFYASCTFKTPTRVIEGIIAHAPHEGVLKLVDVVGNEVDPDAGVNVGRPVQLVLNVTGIAGAAGVRPVSCDAFTIGYPPHPLIRNGCGDGDAIEATSGFTTAGGVSRSPYFPFFRIMLGTTVNFRCNITICHGPCNTGNGTTCTSGRKRRSEGLDRSRRQLFTNEEQADEDADTGTDTVNSLEPTVSEETHSFNDTNKSQNRSGIERLGMFGKVDLLSTTIHDAIIVQNGSGMVIEIPTHIRHHQDFNSTSLNLITSVNTSATLNRSSPAENNPHTVANEVPITTDQQYVYYDSTILEFGGHKNGLVMQPGSDTPTETPDTTSPSVKTITTSEIPRIIKIQEEPQRFGVNAQTSIGERLVGGSEPSVTQNRQNDDQDMTGRGSTMLNTDPETPDVEFISLGVEPFVSNVETLTSDSVTNTSNIVANTLGKDISLPNEQISQLSGHTRKSTVEPHLPKSNVSLSETMVGIGYVKSDEVNSETQLFLSDSTSEGEDPDGNTNTGIEHTNDVVIVKVDTADSKDIVPVIKDSKSKGDGTIAIQSDEIELKKETVNSINEAIKEIPQPDESRDISNHPRSPQAQQHIVEHYSLNSVETERKRAKFAVGVVVVSLFGLSFFAMWVAHCRRPRPNPDD